MSIPVPITRKELNALRRQLRKDQKIVCLDSQAAIKTLLVAQDMLMRGQDVKAKIEYK